MDSKSNVNVELDDVAKVSNNLASLAQSIQSVLTKLYNTVSEVSNGAISGTAPGALIDTYDAISAKLSTYPTTLQTLSENLSTSGNIFNSVDNAATSAASKTQG